MAERVAHESEWDVSRAIGLAQALVATPSVNPSLEDDAPGEAAVAELVSGWLREWGFDVDQVEFAPGRPSVVARLERGPGRALILSGHLDTVGVSDMVVEPFDPVLREGRIWGRGAADMKGGVAAALAAARDVAAGDFRGTLILSLTADEEQGALGCRRVLQDGLGADGAIVCEPTGLAIMPAHKGFAWIEIEFRGQAAHGSRPERGVDAIRHAGLFLARLDELEGALSHRKEHPLLGFGSIHAGTIHGGTAPSVYPSRCRLVLERRTLPRETVPAITSEVQFLLAQLRSEVPSLDAGLEVTLHCNGSEIDSGHGLVTSLSAALESVDIQPRIKGMSAWVEASIYNEAGIPALCFGPGAITEAHTADESAPIDQIEIAHRILLHAARAFLS